jgi:hypothetical protein
MRSFFIVSVVTLVLQSATLKASSVFYADRVSFEQAVTETLTDDYSHQGYGSGVLTDLAMTQVYGQTTYTSISFPNFHFVTQPAYRPNETGYCSGCNGNFQLGFGETSFSKNGGVFGVALDILVHTSRRVSFGDDNPASPSYDGIIKIEFTDGTYSFATIPKDIGYYQAGNYFFGMTDSRGLKTITIGTEPNPQRHIWVIDNLTIADGAVPNPVPLPGTLPLLCVGIASLLATRNVRARER